MSAVNKGVVCIYGIDAGQVASLFVQSYSVSSSFNNSATVMNEEGLTVTARYDDRKSEITVEGIAKSTTVPVLGATFSFTVQTASAYPGGTASASYSGVVTKVDDKGSSKGFVSVSVTAECYEQITY
jgi:hypothetical protein